MSDNSKEDPVTAYLRLLGNPHAKSQVQGWDVDEDLALREPTEAERAYIRQQENPYAVLSVAIGQPLAPASAANPKPRSAVEKATVSKADFVSECTRVLRPYIPSVEKGRLRKHHRHFIDRNKNRSGAERFLLVKELRKYDLSSLVGVSAQFNRERDPLTEQKLMQIERSALSKR